MSKQPVYLENDGLRDSIVEVYYNHSPYRIEHLAKLILESPDLEGFVEINDPKGVFLQNDIYRIQVRSDCISFNNIKTYQRWPNYFPFIQKALAPILALKDINVERLLIRYISMFANVSIFQKLNGQSLKFNALPPIDGTEIRFTMGIADINNNLGIALVRLTDNLSTNNPNIKASVVDIQLETECNSETQKAKLDFIHREERNLFFSLLSKEFIESLGAHYE